MIYIVLSVLYVIIGLVISFGIILLRHIECGAIKQKKLDMFVTVLFWLPLIVAGILFVFGITVLGWYDSFQEWLRLRKL